MLEFLFLSLMGLGAGVIIRVIFESTTGGDSIVFGNSPTHRLYKNNAEARTRDLLKMVQEVQKKSFKNGGTHIIKIERKRHD